jgi:hypothetical protein
LDTVGVHALRIVAHAVGGSRHVDRRVARGSDVGNPMIDLTLWGWFIVYTTQKKWSLFFMGCSMIGFTKIISCTYMGMAENGGIPWTFWVPYFQTTSSY